MKLVSLNDDTLIYILSFLSPAQLISLRKVSSQVSQIPPLLTLKQTCKRMHALTALQIVWTNACLHYIIRNGYPFPNISLDSLSVQELERYVCHSAKLAKMWLSASWMPRRSWSTSATANTSVMDVRLIPGSQGALLFTLSKKIWSAITLWKLEPVLSQASIEKCAFNKCCEWSPRGAISNGFTLNSDPHSEVKLAISSLNNGNHTVELLSLKLQENRNGYCLQPVLSIPSTFRPLALEGDLLAICDDLRETIVFNWRTRAYATLEHTQDGQGILRHDKCIQVIFASHSVLVVRAHSLHLFPFPILKAHEDQPFRYFPIARHSFGWVDSISVVRNMSGQHNSPDKPPTLSILVRAETDDPWASDILTVKLYTLTFNPHYIPTDPPDDVSTQGPLMTSSIQPPQPYIFPPVLISQVISRRGSLCCANIILGRLGTALWIQPKDRFVTGLYWAIDDAPLAGLQDVARSDRRYESLVASVFPGTLFPEKSCESVSDFSVVGQEDVSDAQGKVILWNKGHSWSSIDYDEDVGRIVIGTGFGGITILDM